MRKTSGLVLLLLVVALTMPAKPFAAQASASTSAPSVAGVTAVAADRQTASSTTALRRTPAHFYYSYTFDLGHTGWSRAKTLLHQCFNCYFPVDGAPKAFPKPGQDLPLRAGPFDLGNFHCTFEKEFTSYDQNGSYFGFIFDSAKGHVDGPGAYIGFIMRTTRDGNNILTVNGFVAKNTMIPEAIYKNRAKAMWSKFGKQLRS